MKRKILLGLVQLSILVNFILFVKIYWDNKESEQKLKRTSTLMEVDPMYIVDPEEIYILGEYCTSTGGSLYMKAEGIRFQIWDNSKGDLETVEDTPVIASGTIKVIDSLHAEFDVQYSVDIEHLGRHTMSFLYVAQIGKVVKFHSPADPSIVYDLRNCF